MGRARGAGYPAETRVGREAHELSDDAFITILGVRRGVDAGTTAARDEAELIAQAFAAIVAAGDARPQRSVREEAYKAVYRRAIELAERATGVHVKLYGGDSRADLLNEADHVSREHRVEERLQDSRHLRQVQDAMRSSKGIGGVEYDALCAVALREELQEKALVALLSPLKADSEGRR